MPIPLSTSSSFFEGTLKIPSVIRQVWALVDFQEQRRSTAPGGKT